MPILILHGEHLAHSRQKLGEVLDQAKRQGKEITRLAAASLDLPQLEQTLGENSLFGTPKCVVIEELHSLPTSARKKELLEVLASESKKPETPDIVLWEKRALTKTMISKFPQAQAQEFKISKSIFTWLDSLSGKKGTQQKQLQLLHQAVAEEDEWYCFIMLARQVRLLIQAKEGEVNGAPFMIAKLKKQAGTFSLEQLQRLHTKLLKLDQRHKTSTNTFTLLQDLDLLLLQL
jgi:hypothetical protein